MTDKTLAYKLSVSPELLDEKLIELNLKDPITKLSTDFAFYDSLAYREKKSNENKWTIDVLKFIEEKTKNDNNFLAQRLLHKLKSFHDVMINHDASRRYQDLFDIINKDFKVFWEKHKDNEDIVLLFVKKLLDSPELYKRADWFIDFDEIKPLVKRAKLEKSLPTNINNNKKLKI